MTSFPQCKTSGFRPAIGGGLAGLVRWIGDITDRVGVTVGDRVLTYIKGGDSDPLTRINDIPSKRLGPKRVAGKKV
jgi:hypothetical protein